MARTGLIDQYLADLASRLPASIVAELADGLQETYLAHVRAGHSPADAAHRAVTEFGDPDVVIAAFVGANPARRTARTLLLTGPLVGATWATALIALRAWDWPVPVWVRVGFAVVLVTGVAMLSVAAFGRRYRRATHSAMAACLSILAIDITILSYLGTAGLLTTWPALLAAALSASRSIFTLSRLPTDLAAR
jgi:hypothetical protein